jgi:hypothetical protein
MPQLPQLLGSDCSDTQVSDLPADGIALGHRSGAYGAQATGAPPAPADSPASPPFVLTPSEPPLPPA